MTAPQFAKGVGDCQEVCLLPLGVFQRHDDHLPLGTYLFIKPAIACRAAEPEPAIVFPPCFFTQIF